MERKIQVIHKIVRKENLENCLFQIDCKKNNIKNNKPTKRKPLALVQLYQDP